jgi:methylated-DNA-[protein]-cysteine S-methyltransferase
MEKDLENLKIYKANFQSVIGTIYYLWIESDKVKKTGNKATNDKALNNEEGVQIKLSYLGNREDYFEDYIIKFKKNYLKKDKFFLHEKKSSKIETHISDYLSGKVKNIKIDTYFLFGTDFEKKVWNAAILIPYGKTTSYKGLAEKTGCPLAWRAAGTAIGHNPVMLIVPCHRIIKSDGSIGNFGGGVKIKKFLLNLESPDRN